MRTAEQGPAPDTLLRLFPGSKGLTRAEVIAHTGHARSTVGPRLDQLTRDGLLVAAESDLVTGGRRPVKFVLNEHKGSLLIVDISPFHLRVAITDLNAGILLSERISSPIAADPDDTFDQVDQLITAVARSSQGRHTILGCGVSLPAPVDRVTGRPVRPPRSPRWDGYDVAARIQQTVPVPVTVDSGNNLRALGEYSLDRVHNADILAVNVSTWVGAGAIVNGQLVRGSTGFTGHIGHVKADWPEDDLCMCGNRGCLEAVASGLALLRTYGNRFGVTHTDELVAVAKQGQPELLTAIREVGRKLGLVIAGYVSIINPSRIVLSGPLAEAGTDLGAGVREAVHSRAFPLSAEHLAIDVSTIGPNATIIGAATLALDRYLDRGTNL